MERSADAEIGTGFTPKREAVRVPSTLFALLTLLRMTGMQRSEPEFSEEARRFCEDLMRTTQLYRRPVIFVLTAILSALIVGCSSSSSEDYSHTPTVSSAPAAQSAPAGDNESGAAGVWQGTSLASCAAFTYLPSRCNAEQKVTITLLERPGGKFTGRYTCAYGNMDCFHANYTGKVVEASMNRARLSVRVIMPDGTSCIYTGLNMNQTINGGYSCYQGGGLIEQGSWQAHRSY